MQGFYYGRPAAAEYEFSANKQAQREAEVPALPESVRRLTEIRPKAATRRPSALWQAAVRMLRKWGILSISG
jgi:hypothetical protein